MKITITKYCLIILFLIGIFTHCKNPPNDNGTQDTTLVSCQEDSLEAIFEYYDNPTTIKIAVNKYSYFGTNNLGKPSLFEKPIVQFCENLFIVNSNDIYDLDTSKTTVIKITKDTYYVILRITEFVLNDKYHVFKIYHCNSIIDYIVNDGYFEDIDNDGFVEIGGWEFLDSYNAAGDSSLYNPILIYEIGNDFILDSLASKTIIERKYHTFLGFNRKDTVLRVYDF